MAHPAKIAAFRADGGGQMGAGHLMRCLTLANALNARGYDCHFLTCAAPAALREQMRAAGHQVHMVSPRAENDPRKEPALQHADWLGHSQRADSTACAEVLGNLRPDWLILDHYALDCRWQSDLAPMVTRQLSIDDMADRAFLSDIHVDPNPLNAPQIESRDLLPGDAQALLGCDYALLRPEFTRAEAEGTPPTAPYDILVMMGGVDHADLSSQVVEWLISASDMRAITRRITVVVGAAARISDRLYGLEGTLTGTLRILQNPPDIADLMSAADLCVGAAGGAAWERCATGLPSLTLVTAENQRAIARYLDENGAALSLDSLAREPFLAAFDALCQPGRLLEIRTHAMRLVDGRGTARVIDAMEGLS